MGWWWTDTDFILGETIWQGIWGCWGLSLLSIMSAGSKGWGKELRVCVGAVHATVCAHTAQRRMLIFGSITLHLNLFR